MNLVECLQKNLIAEIDNALITVKDPYQQHDGVYLITVICEHFTFENLAPAVNSLLEIILQMIDTEIRAVTFSANAGGDIADNNITINFLVPKDLI